MVDKITIKGCSEDSVLSDGNKTLLKITQVLEKMQETFSDQNLGNLVYPRITISGVDNRNSANWLEDGVNCEILQPGGKGWQKGKMRLKVNVEVEFIPDEPEAVKPESPLDDLRQKLQKEN